jgi:hypothetical protein
VGDPRASPQREGMRASLLITVASLGCAVGGGDELPARVVDSAIEDTVAVEDTVANDSAIDSARADETAPPPSKCDGPKIDAPKETWAWVPFEAARCGRGTSAGIGINISSKSKKLLIFMMGGGGCYDAASCAAGKAANLDGYDASKLGKELAMFQAGSIVDRTAPQNPFRDYSFVFVPYCTGDFHTGDRVSDYGVHHTGYGNMKKYLAAVVPTFCDVDQVVLTGASAGGFGATFNYAQVRDAFGTRVDLIDDSGPYLRPPYMGPSWQTKLRAAWGFVPNLPAGCSGCETEWHNLYPHLAKTYPDARLSLVMAKMDYSIGTFFGMDPWGMAKGVDDLADAVLTSLPNFRVFLLNSNQHVWTNQNLAAVSSGGTTLSAFLTRQVGDDAAWANVRP